MNKIKLIALDLDGTLLDDHGLISQKNKEAIKKASDAGVHVIISTGRPYSGLPLAQIEGLGMDYAITANGGGIYKLSDGKCIIDNSMPSEVSYPLVDYLLTKQIHFDIFSNGIGYSSNHCLELIDKLPMLKSLTEYIKKTRIRTDDLSAYIREHHLDIQKVTCNFIKDESGNLVDRETVKQTLTANPDITVVCGGYNNLEFTKKGIDKGSALHELCEVLSVGIEQTMAIGDTENDLSILDAVSTAVAMANATQPVKEAADYITLANTQDGVAAAIAHFLPELEW